MPQFNDNFELYIGSSLQTGSFVAPTVGLVGPSGQLAFTALQNTKLLIPNRVYPQVQLRDSSGNAIDDASILFLYHSIPGYTPRYLGQFPMRPFNQVAIANQANTQYKESVAVSLDMPGEIRGGESLIWQFTIPTGKNTIDVSRTDNVLTLKLIEQIGA